MNFINLRWISFNSLQYLKFDLSLMTQLQKDRQVSELTLSFFRYFFVIYNIHVTTQPGCGSARAGHSGRCLSGQISRRSLPRKMHIRAGNPMYDF